MKLIDVTGSFKTFQYKTEQEEAEIQPTIPTLKPEVSPEKTEKSEGEKGKFDSIWSNL